MVSGAPILVSQYNAATKQLLSRHCQPVSTASWHLYAHAYKELPHICYALQHLLAVHAQAGYAFD